MIYPINSQIKFNTFIANKLNIKDYIFESHIYVTDKESRVTIANDIFELLNTAYDEIGGFKSFKDMERFINDSYLWYITYDGPQPEGKLDINKVLAVSVFRQSYGLKMVGMAANRFPGFCKNSVERTMVKAKARSAIQEHIRFVADRGWAEVSDRLEVLFEKSLPWSKYVILPEELIEHRIFNNISIDLDGIHYYRPLRKGELPIRKIAYGTMKF